jgi:hypothetical protein
MDENTRDRLMKIETTLEYIKDSQDANKNEHQEILAKLEDMDKRNDARIKELDRRYADKKVETLVYGLVALILTAFFTTLIYLVIK